ncbi:MAG: fibro-slime domain-containing protein [Chitinivibrionales bacterium]|nr:fibro-slime domain-containing protein [Chitinivibrionales bacterium]
MTGTARYCNLCALLSAVAALLTAVSAQDLPDTLWVKAIYYDFHADGTGGSGSNPEFNVGHSGAGVIRNMVQNSVLEYETTNAGYFTYPKFSFDSIAKPVLGSNPFKNCEISRWYRSWEPVTRIPDYGNTFGCSDYRTVGYDTAFKNIVIKDSLPFTIFNQQNGTYRYERTGHYTESGEAGGFFPIDDKGFGSDLQGQLHNYSFTMELHFKFTYQPGLEFDFLGDDDLWVYIDGELALDLGGVHNSAPGSIDLDNLGLIDGQEYVLDLFYAERNQNNSRIRITTNIFTPEPENLVLQTGTDTISAGDTTSIIAKIITNSGDTIPPDSSIYDLVSWDIPSMSMQPRPGDTIWFDDGHYTVFSGTQAFRNVKIIAGFTDQNDASNVLFDTASVYIKPGADYQAVIERSSRTQLSADDVRPNTYADSVLASPLSIISMDSAQNDVYVYGVVRDSSGNYKRLLTNGEWNSLDPNIFTVAMPGSGKWEAQVTRVTKGADTLEALEPGLVADSVEIVLSAGVLVGLRVIDSITGQVVDTISITTDDVVNLLAEGKWSDNLASWVTQPASWNMDPDTLRSANQIPTGDRATWVYSPINPGRATLTVSSGNQSVDIPVIVTPAPPSGVSLDLLTSNPTAGVPFQAVVTITNSDGLVPGTYCYYPDSQALYWDILGNGNAKKDPTVQTGQDSTNLNVRSNKNRGVTQCFENGVDTVAFVLYNAPLPPDNQHQLWVQLDGAPPQPITAKTPKFILQPGDVDSIVLEYPGGAIVPDSVALNAPDDDLFIQAIGYDQFGNRIGPIVGVWNPGGSLHPIDDDTSQVLYYSTQEIKLDEKGCVVVTSRDKPGATPDRVCLTITAPKATISTAATRDSSGNGYLDIIKVTFDKEVTIGTGYSLDNINLFHTYDPNPRDSDPGTTYSFEVTDIQALNGTDTDTLFYLAVKEVNTGKIPQTDWEPTIQFKNNAAISNNEFQVGDGAGPVVWDVFFDKRKENKIVTVTFSEPLENVPGPSMARPELVLNVWYDSTESVDTMFSEVEFFRTSTENNKAYFELDEKHLLTNRHFISINMSGEVYLVDRDKLNPPVVDNQRVRVDVKDIAAVQAAPNPFPPGNPNMLLPGDDQRGFAFHDRATRKEAFERTIGRAGGGMLLKIDLPLPSVCKTPVEGDIVLEGRGVVFDIVGNKVKEVTYENLFPEEYFRDYEGGIKKDIAIYWDGTNNGGLAVSPGAYIMYIDLKLKADVGCEGGPVEQHIWSRKDPVKLGVRR